MPLLNDFTGNYPSVTYQRIVQVADQNTPNEKYFDGLGESISLVSTNNTLYYTSFYDGANTNAVNQQSALGGNSLSAQFPVNKAGTTLIMFKQNAYNHIHYVNVFNALGAGKYTVEMTLTSTIRSSDDYASCELHVYSDTCSTPNILQVSTFDQYSWYSMQYAFNNALKMSNLNMANFNYENLYTGNNAGPSNGTTWLDTTKTYGLNNITIDSNNQNLRFLINNYVTSPPRFIALQRTVINWKIIKVG